MTAGLARWRGSFDGIWPRIKPLAPWISLGIGAWSAFGVVRHYEQARRVAWLLAGIWIAFGVLAWLRNYSRRHRQAPGWMGAVVFGCAWLAQSMSQEILFFVLPFWIRSTTWTSRNCLFTCALLVLAAATAFDPVYQGRIATRTRLLLLHKALVAFAGLAFVVPALLGAHTTEALALAGGLAGLATTFAVRSRSRLRTSLLGLFLGAVFAVGARGWIAPVPLRVESATFASGVRSRLPVDTLRQARPGRELWAWTPVFAPSGLTDTVVHEWTRDGRVLATIPLVLHGGRKEGFRTWSSSRWAAAKPGDVRVDVATSGGQLVGRMTISVR